MEFVYWVKKNINSEDIFSSLRGHVVKPTLQYGQNGVLQGNYFIAGRASLKDRCGDLSVVRTSEGLDSLLKQPI